jgi:hypothetical protein
MSELKEKAQQLAAHLDTPVGKDIMGFLERSFYDTTPVRKDKNGRLDETAMIFANGERNVVLTLRRLRDGVA